jgi:hypothetical protein
MKVNIGRYPKGDKDRKISIKIDPWDSWSADHSIALIAAPLLIQLKETKHGSPNVDDADVPEHLRSTAAPTKENEWDTDDNWHLRWDYVMGEMIYAMQEIANHNKGEEIFWDHSEVDETKDIMEQVHAMKLDRVGLDAYQQRIQKGCELFGKYFQSLWD